MAQIRINTANAPYRTYVIRNVFSRLRNTDSDMSSWSVAGKLFHTAGPLTALYKLYWHFQNNSLYYLSIMRFSAIIERTFFYFLNQSFVTSELQTKPEHNINSLIMLYTIWRGMHAVYARYALINKSADRMSVVPAVRRQSSHLLHSSFSVLLQQHSSTCLISNSLSCGTSTRTSMAK